ncbi:MAG: hypothetical protein RMI91_01905 [Gemmatales bacterium]|nr:hypothetical protein [Gemmatales bacterium]MDW7993381.1 hypothetical protein [Gemmatales bacterium]
MAEILAPLHALVFCAVQDAAQAPQTGTAQQLLWLWIILGGAVLVFAVIISIARTWYQRMQEQKEIERELLTEFQEAVERGEMSPEEFARVRRLLVGRMTRDATAAPQPPSALQQKLPEEELPLLEQDTSASPAPESNPAPPTSEYKSDTDSSSPETSAHP